MPLANTLQIHVVSEDHGRRWRSEVNGEVVYRGKHPHFGACRALIAAGYDPETPVETFAPHGTRVFASTLVKLAAWTTSDPDSGRPGILLVRYRPKPSVLWTGKTSERAAGDKSPGAPPDGEESA